MANLIPLIGSGGIGKSSACISAALRLHDAGFNSLYIPGAVVNFIGIIDNLLARQPATQWAQLLGQITLAQVDGTVAHSIARNIAMCKLSFVDRVKISILLKTLLPVPSHLAYVKGLFSNYYSAFKKYWSLPGSTALAIAHEFMHTSFPSELKLKPIDYLEPLAHDFQRLLDKRTAIRDANGTVTSYKHQLYNPEAPFAIQASVFPGEDQEVEGLNAANEQYNLLSYLQDCLQGKCSIGRMEVDSVLCTAMAHIKFILIDSYETMAGVESVLAPGAVDIGPTIKLPEMQTQLSTIFPSDATIIVTSRLPASYFDALVANAQSGILLRKEDMLVVSSGYRNNPYYFRFSNRDVPGNILVEFLNYGAALHTVAPLNLLPYFTQKRQTIQFDSAQIIDSETWFDWLKAMKEEGSSEKDALASVMNLDRLAHYEVSSGASLNASMNAFIRGFTPSTTVQPSNIT